MALGGKDDMLAVLEENIAMVLALEDENSMESIDAKLEEQQQELQASQFKVGLRDLLII